MHKIKTSNMNLKEKLSAIQVEMKAPKNQYNSFGKYNYRSAEDILEAVKPFEKKYKVVIVLNDQLTSVVDRPYIHCAAFIRDCESDEEIHATAQAIIDFDAKGMQMPQRTGAASSYAKKYALGNLLLLDDTKDSDATNNHGKQPKNNSESKATKKDWLNKGTKAFDDALKAVKAGQFTVEQIKVKYNMSKEVEQLLKG